jgi:hypothetical protein
MQHIMASWPIPHLMRTATFFAAGAQKEINGEFVEFVNPLCGFDYDE